MANDSSEVRRAESGTLTPGQEKTIRVLVNANGAEIINRSMSGELWYTVDDDDTDLKPEGDDCFVVLATRHIDYREDVLSVRMFATTAIRYTVEGAQR